MLRTACHTSDPFGHRPNSNYAEVMSGGKNNSAAMVLS